MCKYNVGEMVKLRNDLKEGAYYGVIEFLTEMKKLQNKPIQIKHIDPYDNTYKVETEDGWWISDEMIEGFWRENKQKLKMLDVLNMMENGELQAGTKVIYKGLRFTYESPSLYDNEGDPIFLYINDLPDLSRECELIEPKKECKHEWKIGGIRDTIDPLQVVAIERCKKCGMTKIIETKKQGNYKKPEHIREDTKMIEDTQIPELDISELEIEDVDDLAFAFANMCDQLNKAIRKANEQTKVILALEKDINDIKEQLDY